MGEKITGRKEYQGFYKDNDGEAHIVDMVSKTIEPDPEVDRGNFITQARPLKITPPRYARPKRRDQLTLTFGDAQIPFHDERALRLAIVAIKELKPDNVLLLGDMIDLPNMGTYEKRKEWAETTQGGIDRFHQFLGDIRGVHGGRLIVVHGNHEERMPKMLRRDAAELIGLRRANAEKELGVLSLSYLLRYEELDVEAHTGYPNGVVWLEDNLRGIHGTEAKRRGGSASAYLRNEMVSTLFGHDHRTQVIWQTRMQRVGGYATVSASGGCLADLNGRVPSQFYTSNDMNQTVPYTPDWQQGGLAVLHNPRNHDVVPLRIGEQGIHIGDKHYE